MRPLAMPPAALGASCCSGVEVEEFPPLVYSLCGEKTERGLLLLQVICRCLQSPAPSCSWGWCVPQHWVPWAPGRCG